MLRVFHDPKDRHFAHNPSKEFSLGHILPHFHESPERHTGILETLRQHHRQSPSLFDLVAFEGDYGMGPLLRIHSPGYLEYLQTISSQWLEFGGSTETGVIGDTFPVNRPLFKFPIRFESEENVADKQDKHAVKTFIDHLAEFAIWMVGTAWSWYRWLRFGDLQLKRTQRASKGLLSSHGNPGYFSSDIEAPIMEGTWQAAYAASQLAIHAAEMLIQEDKAVENDKSQYIPGVFALCRPPGHHAHSELTGGFCYLNNVAIAAQYLIDHFGKRVVILDIDNHHGNGTQQIFYRVPNPRFISLHASLDYPWFTGGSHERGEGAGYGHTVNVPLMPGTDTDVYLTELNNALKENNLLNFSKQNWFQTLLGKLFSPYRQRPDVLMVSLGVDPYISDPVGTLGITTDGFYSIGKAIGLCRIPTCFVMEGGYDLDNIGNNVVRVLQGFADAHK